MIGCSVDTLEDQQAFADKLDLRIPLIADPDGEIARSFDVTREDYGGLAGRSTAIVDVDGTTLKAYPDAPSSGHAQQVLEDLEALLS